jgi:hypothetical protein
MREAMWEPEEKVEVDRSGKIPINPSKVPAHPNPRFENNCGEASGKNAPKAFLPRNWDLFDLYGCC